jgi:cytochrome c peroxidase
MPAATDISGTDHTKSRPTGTGRGAGTSASPSCFAVRRIAGRGEFKTPTLREVARTAPYTHDGSLRALDEVMRFPKSTRSA